MSVNLKPKDKVDLLKSLNIFVFDSASSDDLLLVRNKITVPYNATNFMLITEEELISDVLRRFREKQMDTIPEGDTSNEYVYDDDIYEDEGSWMDVPVTDLTINSDDERYEDYWEKLNHESNDDMDLLDERMCGYLCRDNRPVQYKEINIVLKKKNIRDKLIEKGLLCTES